MKSSDTSGGEGFSMVEVVLALGLISFGLIALLGLVSVGLDSSKKSSEDTLIASMTTHVMSQVRSGTLSSLLAAHYYFDHSGQTTNSTSAYYDCNLTMRYPAATEAAAPTSALAMVSLQFTWPAMLPDGKRPHTNTVYASAPIQ